MPNWGLCQFTIHDPTMHDSCINYANTLALYRDNSQFQGKKKYNRNTKEKLVSFAQKIFNQVNQKRDSDTGASL